MERIYKSSEGFYPGEALSTLYVSNMIIVNIPYLLEMHPQETEQFYTAVYLAEHNFVNLSMLGAIQGVLAGVPEKAENVPAEAVSVPTAETVSEPEATVSEECVADTCETVENSPYIAPITEETVKNTEEQESEESVWISTEAEYITTEAYEAVDDAPCAETAACETVENDSYISPATEEIGTDEHAQPERNELIAVDTAVRATPEGEQLTMAFPTISNEQDGEEIFTLELDSFN